MDIPNYEVKLSHTNWKALSERLLKTKTGYSKYWGITADGQRRWSDYPCKLERPVRSAAGCKKDKPFFCATCGMILPKGQEAVFCLGYLPLGEFPNLISVFCDTECLLRFAHWDTDKDRAKKAREAKRQVKAEKQSMASRFCLVCGIVIDNVPGGFLGKSIRLACRCTKCVEEGKSVPDVRHCAKCGTQFSGATNKGRGRSFCSSCG